MDQIMSAPPPRAAVSTRRRAIGASIIVATIAVAAIAFRAWWFVPVAASSIPTSPAIEATWGVRVTHVAVTADGGLVEMRFLVLDSDRALAMMQDVSNVPVLRVEANGTLVRSAALMTAKHAIAPGRTGFMLYRNTKGAIQPGTSIAVVFGKLELQHVLAQ